MLEERVQSWRKRVGVGLIALGVLGMAGGVASMYLDTELECTEQVRAQRYCIETRADFFTGDWYPVKIEYEPRSSRYFGPTVFGPSRATIISMEEAAEARTRVGHDLGARYGNAGFDYAKCGFLTMFAGIGAFLLGISLVYPSITAPEDDTPFR